MSKRILVVEDFATIRHFICETLRARGYDTIGVASVQDAWATISLTSREIDLVVTDYHMEGGDGLELLKMIKQHPQTNRIPVIFLTSEASPEKISEAKEKGIFAWIIKPYRTATFFAAIEEALASR